MKRILVTAGPTEEPVDAVRFISNYATGQIGVELAREARRRGWAVTLILGPSHVRVPAGVRLVRVRTAREMQRAVRRCCKECRVIIMAAAVSDWRPARTIRGKMKRADKPRVIRLVENPDILKTLGSRKGSPLFRVGFCLEYGDPRREARRKLRDKGLDLIVANRIGAGGAPFGRRPMAVWLIGRGARDEQYIRAASKRTIARRLLSYIHGAMAE